MSGKVILVVPEAPATQAPSGSAARRRLAAEAGVRLGILDNSKGNADHLLQLIVDGVRATDVPIRSVVSLRKGSVSLPAPAAILDQLAREADVVVSAMGD